MRFSKEFKEAITHLPEKEKNKLLLRLLKKDQDLVDRLTYELLDTDSIEERREDVIEEIEDRTQYMKEHFTSPGMMMMDLRYLSGDITSHVKTTKDKFGEAYLNLIMLIEALQKCNDLIRKKAKPNDKLCIYIIARAFKILVLMDKLHDDLFMEFEGKLGKLGKLIGANDNLMRTAIFHGLDVNWIISEDIPEDIAQQQKDLRKQGYLKHISRHRQIYGY